MNDRHQRVESLLRELVAGFIANEANSNPLITITQVSVSPDYRSATVFFTTIPEDREQDALIFMKRFGGDIRKHVMKGSDLKIVPEFRFSIDGGERARQYLDTVADQIKLK